MTGAPSSAAWGFTQEIPTGNRRPHLTEEEVTDASPPTYQRQPAGDAMKTLAIKLEDSAHGQLTAIAQLEGQPVTLLIKQAIEAFIESKRNAPELTARAADALAEIERDAATRREAIATLFGSEEGQEPPATNPPMGFAPQRRGRGKGGEPAES
jgi:predicted transcriptional regulator